MAVIVHTQAESPIDPPSRRAIAITSEVGTAVQPRAGEPVFEYSKLEAQSCLGGDEVHTAQWTFRFLRISFAH